MDRNVPQPPRRRAVAALAASLLLAVPLMAACQARDPNDPTNWQNALDQMEQESSSASGQAGSGEPEAAEGEASGEGAASDGAEGSPAAAAPEADDEEEEEEAAAFPADQLVDADYVAGLIDAGKVKSGEAVIVDIRALGYYMYQRIEGSINIPAGRQFELRLREIGLDQEVVLVGESNSRYAACLETLLENGYDAANIEALDGGLAAWVEAGYEIVADADYKC